MIFFITVACHLPAKLGRPVRREPREKLFYRENRLNDHCSNNYSYLFNAKGFGGINVKALSSLIAVKISECNAQA